MAFCEFESQTTKKDSTQDTRNSINSDFEKTNKKAEQQPKQTLRDIRYLGPIKIQDSFGISSGCLKKVCFWDIPW